jgi:haloacetate dehalogenase
MGETPSSETQEGGAMFEEFEQLYVNTECGRSTPRIGGSGLPVSMLHGHPLSHILWHAEVDSLSDHDTVIIVDLPGCGSSFPSITTLEYFPRSTRELARA